MSSFQLTVLLVILVVTAISGIYPFVKKANNQDGFHFPVGEALASGVFLGAGLIHMLGDSAGDFSELNIDYPFPFLIAGITILLFLLLEHIGGALSKSNKGNLSFMAIMATIMLSIHSFFEGAALGLSEELSVALVIFLAIIAHKWAASFALAISINKTSLRFLARLILFIIFVFMTPLGILFGQAAHNYVSNPFVEPTFTAIAAGTFIYMGTLHGLDRSVLIKDCCNTKQYSFVIIGFSIMAIVAIWT
ncbi:ZIP Zinc transporter family protein [Francisella philomiragia subsp. philomiragia ATCC 25015]|uniref:ZIP family metal transporter n=1 Tax=Francisella philomiragia TaxID=28110 RepID=UPI0001AF77DC|nr:ZIP family metal transporter [Francisella philomiragia]AJI74230.1 ZIP Zinc transporter family protein [Francisella philomiragia subsp. philomiragia ATCC 25015]EET21493.1 ZIP metal transporter family protein [Francisella philomiragia subsp. philomiragia ATCC 25015]MBK2237923.1 ZIP family metal transporter [Francisella philomiragia]